MSKRKIKANIQRFKTQILPVVFIFGKPSGSGIECLFYKRSDNAKKGYKIYETHGEAVAAQKRQERAYNAGIAPKAGPIFLSVIYSKYHCHEIGYGYETQIAKPVKKKFFNKHKEKIKSKLNKMKIETLDLWPHNCGQIRNKLVMVDFGNASCKLY